MHGYRSYLTDLLLKFMPFTTTLLGVGTSKQMPFGLLFELNGENTQVENRLFPSALGTVADANYLKRLE